jgi:hypothetical protein
METIHRLLDNIPLPDVRVCQHLAMMIDNDQWPSRDAKSCANCSGLLCPSCEDDAVHCSGGTCLGLICEECQATARKRDVDTTGPTRAVGYLCAPCCAKQDAAQKTLHLRISTLDDGGIFRSDAWLDDIVAKLDEALERAKEAL